MKDIHVVQVGRLLHNQESFTFLSSQNLNEFDFIVIDTNELLASLNGEDFRIIEKRLTELSDFVTFRNIPVVFICVGNATNWSQETHKHYSVFDLLKFHVVQSATTGKKVDVNSDSIFRDLLAGYEQAFTYDVCFTKHPGTSIGKAKGNLASIGFYTKDFVFLPRLDNRYLNDAAFLKDLYDCCKIVRLGNDELQLPEWVSDYNLPGEEEEEDRIEELDKKINTLKAAKSESECRLLSFLPLKQLWTATGNQLEDLVKKVFVELGFNLLPTEERRDDIIMELHGQVVVVEIKGQTKSAAEKNAAQLEKWISTYRADHDGVTPKGLLVVNTFREQPLEARNQPSFPNQMLPYSIAREHCLLTTLQLCSLLLFCRANVDLRESAIEKLLNTNGTYQEFGEWNEFISKKINNPTEMVAEGKSQEEGQGSLI
jgi:hypothetical protein